MSTRVVDKLEFELTCIKLFDQCQIKVDKYGVIDIIASEISTSNLIKLMQIYPEIEDIYLYSFCEDGSNYNICGTVQFKN